MVLMGFAGCAMRSDTITPADGVAGLGVRILAERDRLLREARDSRAVGQLRGARGWVKGTTASD